MRPTWVRHIVWVPKNFVDFKVHFQQNECIYYKYIRKWYVFILLSSVLMSFLANLQGLRYFLNQISITFLSILVMYQMSDWAVVSLVPHVAEPVFPEKCQSNFIVWVSVFASLGKSFLEEYVL